MELVNMSKKFLLVGAAVAILAVVFSPEAHAQGAFGFPAGAGGGVPCANGACGVDAGAIGAQQRSFGYGQVHDRFHATQEQNAKIYARNAAWPKPFACASRQHYHNTWRAMFDAGWEDQSILTATHFDEEGDLTRYGKHQIGGMMMNMPRARRVIYVQETSDPAETESRMAKVRDVIQTWYAQRGGRVQVSKRVPALMPGIKAVDIINKATTAAPVPIIPIADGTSSVAGSIGQ